MQLPPVLSADDLPVPELYAAKLDGQVFAIDTCFAPVDEIEQPRHRAAALRTTGADRLIAEQFTAAWVWGALDNPPLHHQFCVATGARVSHSAARWMTLREVVIGDDEIVELGGGLVTTPTRTVVDLARFALSFDVAVVDRLVAAGASLERAIEAVARRRNLPNKNATLAKLRRFL